MLSTLDVVSYFYFLIPLISLQLSIHNRKIIDKYIVKYATSNVFIFTRNNLFKKSTKFITIYEEWRSLFALLLSPDGTLIIIFVK